MDPSPASSRRGVLAAVLALVVVIAACGSASSSTTATSPGASAPVASVVPASSAAPSPAGTAPSAGGSPAASQGAVACTAPATSTTAQTEGPYFKAGSPERSVLADSSTPGTHLTLEGIVVGTDCAPISGALVEIWQADASGAYDNAGYGFRGHVLTDAAGRFTIETVVPGEYPGRTPHIHLKLTPPGGSTLTTQVYFPDANRNSEDGIFRPELLLAVTANGDAKVGTYTFVLGD
jgi:protocatechuate 3,4-dioxygenase beta subunit